MAVIIWEAFVIVIMVLFIGLGLYGASKAEKLGGKNKE